MLEVPDNLNHFSVRQCPSCGISRARILFNLSSELFCSVNWTYKSKYKEILELPGDLFFPVVKCKNCGFMYSRFLPSDHFLRKLYDEVISADKCLSGSENLPAYSAKLSFLSKLLHLAHPQKVVKALDFGCGIGVSLRLLSALNIEAVGYEPSNYRHIYTSQKGIKVAKELSELKNHGPFQIIICDNVLEHLPHPVKTIDLFSSLSVPGTILFLSVPNFDKKSIKREVKKIKNGEEISMALNPWEHLNYFNIEQLDQMLSKYNFSPIINVNGSNSVNIGLRFEANLLKRLSNGFFSFFRLIKYSFKGKPIRNVNELYYKYQPPP